MDDGGVPCATVRVATLYLFRTTSPSVFSTRSLTIRIFGTQLLLNYRISTGQLSHFDGETLVSVFDDAEASLSPFDQDLSHSQRNSARQHLLQGQALANRQERRRDSFHQHFPRGQDMVGSTRAHNYIDTMAKHKSGGNGKTTGKANKIAALEAELAALKRGNSGGNGKKNTNKHKKRKTSFVKPAPVILAVADTKEQVERVTKTKIWRKCKFLAMKEELMAVSYEIMREIPQFRSMIGDSKLEDPQVTAQVEAFMGAYGETVTKTINNCRTNVQNALRTSFLLRESTGAHMPTCEELFNVIHRQGLEKDDDDAQKEKARDIFKWFWDDLLPKVCGKTRFGRSIRHYTTICEGPSHQRQPA